MPACIILLVCMYRTTYINILKMHFCCRNDDREILLECQKKGPSSKTFVSLATRLNKSPNQVGDDILIFTNSNIPTFTIAVEQESLEIFCKSVVFFSSCLFWGILVKKNLRFCQLLLLKSTHYRSTMGILQYLFDWYVETAPLISQGQQDCCWIST